MIKPLSRSLRLPRWPSKFSGGLKYNKQLEVTLGKGEKHSPLLRNRRLLRPSPKNDDPTGVTLVHELIGEPLFVDATNAALEKLSSSQRWQSVAPNLPTIRQHRDSSIENVGTEWDVLDDAWRLPVLGYAGHLAALAFLERARGATPPGDFRIQAEAESAAFVVATLLELDAEDELIDRVYRDVVTRSLGRVRNLPYDTVDGKVPTVKRISKWLTFGEKATGWLLWRLQCRAVRCEGVRVLGRRTFLRNTCAALEALRTSRHRQIIYRNIDTVRESCRDMGCQACTKVDHDHPEVHVASEAGQRLNPVEYAGVLAHEAFHNMLYRNHEECEGAEAERRCIDYELEVLRELRATDALLRKVERTKFLPLHNVPPDEFYWQQFDWRHLRQQ